MRDRVMLRALSLGSPPTWDDAPPELQIDLAALDELDDDARWTIARSHKTAPELAPTMSSSARSIRSGASPACRGASRAIWPRKPATAGYAEASVSSSILLEIVFTDAVCTIHRGRSLLVLSWHATPTASVVAAMATVLTAAVRSSPDNMLICALIDTRMPMPDGPAREALEAKIQRLGPLRGVVNVVSGTGFRAAALRGLLSGLARVTRPKYPVSYVGSTSEAASVLVASWPPSDAPVPAQSEITRVLTAVMPTYVEPKMA